LEKESDDSACSGESEEILTLGEGKKKKSFGIIWFEGQPPKRAVERLARKGRKKKGRGSRARNVGQGGGGGGGGGGKVKVRL